MNCRELIKIDGVVDVQQTIDSPYRGNKWAKPSHRHLRQLMRTVVTDWESEAALLLEKRHTADAPTRTYEPFCPESRGVSLFVNPGGSDAAARGTDA